MLTVIDETPGVLRMVRTMRTGQVPDLALNTHRLLSSELPAGFADLLRPSVPVVKAIVEC